jgi:hypothetical protein
VEKASRNLAVLEAEEAGGESEATEKILISLAYPDSVEELVDFGLMLKPKKSSIPVYALNIISDDSNDETTQFSAKKMMDSAIKQAAATENTIVPLTRFDVNISNGIIYTIKEQKITDVLIGLHKNTNQKNFLGPITEDILSRSSETIFIYKHVQPFNTLKRMIVAVTPNAELEQGFAHWFSRILTISQSGGLPIHFFADPETIKELQKMNTKSPRPAVAIYNVFNNWDDFLILSRELKQNDFFVIISSRKDHISYNPQLEKLPYYLTKYFNTISFIIVYPQQISTALLNEAESVDSSLLDTLADNLQVVNKAGNYISNIFKKKK